MTTIDTTVITLDSYSAAFDDAMIPSGHPALAAGTRVRIPEDPNGTGCTVDGREWDAFRRSMARQVGDEAELDYTHSEDGWDYYTIQVFSR